ncbi:SAP30-binding protein-like [Physella acuta]|uniref:SAP30-binding protein-like n=1 Tax=Physella acuta TaxID=109671 RepID=UPI0027DE003B|nr:SAP30-binding protein-like [Physella acuta]
MMRHDSNSIISSLQMDYADSDEEENDSKNNSKNNPNDFALDDAKMEEETHDSVSGEIPFESQMTYLEKDTDKVSPATERDSEDKSEARKEPEVSPAELISDDEDGHTHSQQRHRHSPHISEFNRRLAVSDAVNTDSPSSQGSVKPGKKATRLVSYGPDEDLDENSSSEEIEEEETPELSDSNSPELTSTDASILSRSVQNMASDDIKIPPEPTGKCSVQLQKKIEDMYERMRREGLDLNRAIQSKKNFRNPSIYEKLIDYCHIDEKGTNFPPEIYDPHIWGKESFYDELDKLQRKDMERREKEKKERTKIEFMTGTKKPASADGSVGPSDEKKRKTKWDAQPASIIHVSKIPSASQNPGVVNLTAMATGTKATIIPAVGSLSKKPSSSSGK